VDRGRFMMRLALVVFVGRDILIDRERVLSLIVRPLKVGIVWASVVYVWVGMFGRMVYV
jgi:hypothetical protein